MKKQSKARILVVDDDARLVQDVKRHLEKQGYTVDTATDGRTALALAESSPPSLVLLDISFPQSITRDKQTMDGIEVLRRLRESDNVPVLMLSATNITSVKIMVLDIGADDYLSKPFDLHELGARIGAILRRNRASAEFVVLEYSRLRLDPGERRVWKDGQPVELTAVEFDLLYTLARRPNHVFTREKLLELAWKEANFSIPKVVDVHVGHIRKKIEDDPANPAFVITVRGTGYRFEDGHA